MTFRTRCRSSAAAFLAAVAGCATGGVPRPDAGDCAASSPGDGEGRGPCSADVAPAAEAPPGSPFVLGFAGDTLLGDAAQPLLDDEGYDAPFAALRDVPRGCVLVANLEGPITDRQEQYNPGQTWHYNARPEAAEALARFGVGVGGLANNHVFDRGPGGLQDTLLALDAAGILAVGAGADAAEAEAPVLLDSPHGRVAIVAAGATFSTVPQAQVDAPGVPRLDAATLQRLHDAAREAGAEHVVAFVHWGSNYSAVTDAQREAAERFAAIGYDLVVGHGAHVLQEVEIVAGMPVLHSIGNFVFGTPGRFDAEFRGFGALARVELGAAGFETLRLRCLRTDNALVSFVPRPCTGEETAEALPGLHPDLVLEGDEAVLAL